MKARALAATLACALLGACHSTDDRKPPAPTPRPVENVQATPEVLHAFRDEVYAHYDLRLLTEPNDPRQDPHALKDQVAKATQVEAGTRQALVEALEAAGSRSAPESASKGLPGLIPIVRVALERHERYVFIILDSGDNPSFALVQLIADPVARKRSRTIALFEEKFSYELYVHDETVVEDYPTYRARLRTPAGAPPVFRPAVTLGNRIYLDRAAMERMGRESFFPRVEHYRALARAASDDAFFLKEAEDKPKFLGAVKELLRWRSLEGLWSTVHSLPPEEQGQRFADDYQAREEIRAAAEAYELARAKAAGDEKPSLEHLSAIERRAMLSAIVHGEPLGETATAVGLAGARVAEEEAARTRGVPPTSDPQRRVVLDAAKTVVASLVRELTPPGAPRDDYDASDFARLARANPDDLRAAALSVYKREPAPKK